MYRSIVAIMIVVVLMMGYGTWGGYKMVTQSTPLINAALEIRLAVTEAHLWFEEIISGDTAEDIAEVWKNLDKAERLTMAMLEGGTDDQHTYIPLDDAALKSDLRKVHTAVARFRSIAIQRRESQTAGIGSDLDQEFDTVYRSLMKHAEHTEASLYRALAESLRTFLIIQACLILTAGMLFTYIVRTLIRSEKAKDEQLKKIHKSAEDLQAVVAKNEEANWLKTGQAELSDAMRGEPDLPTLSRNVITYLAKYLDARVGVVYLSDDDGTLGLTGSYAFTQRKHLANTIKPGEGLVGQAALEKESISISEVPEDYITVSSGLGEAVPRSLLAIPVMFEEKVKGVLELGTFTPFNDTQIELLNLVSENIAIVINSAQDREKMSALLQQSQRQSEELQAQQEELRATNEELEEQTEALKRSEENLKTQSEELQATNEELEEKSESLSQQKADIEKKNRDLEAFGREIEEKAHDLELASKYKSEFLANMSHELRTPLNSLLILSKSLAANEEGNLTDEQVESAGVINDGGKDLLHLINEILDLSKVEAGKLDVHFEDVRLDSIVGHLETQFKPMADDKGLRFQSKIADGLPDSLRTDGQRVEQILKNLLSNAMKFTSRGSVTVRLHRPDQNIRFRRSGLSAENTIAISVIDTGIGIPEDRQRVIFEAFQQADGSTSRKFGGTGLGLAISRELAKLLGCEIQLRSRQGEGTTFSLYLPLEPQGLPPAETPSQPATESRPATVGFPATADAEPESTDASNSPPAPAVPEFIADDRRRQIGDGDKTVLIIEDDRRFAKILTNLSRKRGYKCLVARDGSSGLQLALEHRPTGIILDLGLPDIDGLNVLGQLKDNVRTRHIPVHVVSARDEIAASLRQGAIGHMTKPASAEDLDQAFSRMEDMLQADVRKILVVEDDDVLRTNLVKLIDNKGVEITGVGTGEEACQQVVAQKFDGVILDLGLPDMTGFELLQRVPVHGDCSALIGRVQWRPRRERAINGCQARARVAESLANGRRGILAGTASDRGPFVRRSPAPSKCIHSTDAPFCYACLA